MSTSDILQVERTDPVLTGVPWRARLRAQCREFLLRSWTLRQMHKAVYSHEGALKLAAMLDGAEYAAEHMRNAHASSDRDEILLRGVDQAPHDGLFIEFGVWSGRTVNLIAERINATVHGFDAFEAPPKHWEPGYSRTLFHADGRRASVRPNVTLHLGVLRDTLPGFITKFEEPVALLHINCYLYSSTQLILHHLANHIRPGTVIVFGQYFNYPGWRNHAYRAFQEFVEERSLGYRYLSYNTVGWNVAVQINRQ
jgi:hypothetical protein